MLSPPLVYFDWNATAPLTEEVIAFLHTLEADSFLGNGSSVHRPGQKQRARLEQVRAWLKQDLQADELVWTSSATEAHNLLFSGFETSGSSGASAACAAGLRFLVAATEHPSVLEAARVYGAARGLACASVPTDSDGRVLLSELAALLASDSTPCLVSIQLANSETGVLQPLSEIRATLDKASFPVWLHCDATQAFGGKADEPLADIPWDLLSFSGHKIGALPGVGGLVWRTGAFHIKPLLYGGGQENAYRPGTENVLAIHSLGLATQNPYDWRGTQELRDELEKRLPPGIQVIGQHVPRLSNSTCLLFQDARAVPDVQALLVRLDLAGIAVSSGTACASGALRGSPTLRACGYDATAARRMLRVSLGPRNNAAELDYFLACLEASFAA